MTVLRAHGYRIFDAIFLCLLAPCPTCGKQTLFDHFPVAENHLITWIVYFVHYANFVSWLFEILKCRTRLLISHMNLSGYILNMKTPYKIYSINTKTVYTIIIQENECSLVPLQGLLKSRILSRIFKRFVYHLDRLS